jgi:hypothetical protein
MKITQIMTIAAVVAVSPKVGQADHVSARTMTAYLIDHRHECYRSTATAEKISTKIFAAIDLKLEWRHSRPPARPDPSALTFIIELIDNTPGEYRPNALAFATPYEGVHIKVFFDRVVRMDREYPDAILGHVLAHEITHLIEGVKRHSKTGLMKAWYSPSEIAGMRKHPMAIAEEDIVLIRLSLQGRLAARGKLQPAAASEPR